MKGYQRYLTRTSIFLLCGVFLLAISVTLGSLPAFSQTAKGFFGFGAPALHSCAGGTFIDRSKCWGDVMKQDLDADKIPEAFLQLRLFSKESPDFIQTCHSFTHRIGERAYEDFKAGRSVEPSADMQVCDFGFYHGFMTAFLQESHNFAEVGKFCASMQQVDDHGSAGSSRDACFHGIGHGSIVGNDGVDWANPLVTVHETLAVCKASAQNENDYIKCAAGAYNGMAYGPYHDTVLNPKDPFKICRQLAAADIPRECYANLASVVFNLTPDKTVTEAIDLSSRFTPPDMLLAIIPTFANMATRNAGDAIPVVETCLSLPTDQKQSCMVGVVSGLVQAELPNTKEKSAYALCSGTLIPEEDRTSCFAYTLNVLTGFWAQNKLVHACDSAPRNSLPACTAALTQQLGQ